MAPSHLQLLPLLLIVVLRGALANPLYTSLSDSDLADLKTLWERFEERLPAKDDLISSQGALGQGYETREASNSAPSVDGDNSRSQREAALSGGPWELPDQVTQVKNQLRELLNAPRSLKRSSDCFGVRLDRIGTLSGMGCNNQG